MNRESFNSNTSQSTEDITKDLEDPRSFDLEKLDALKADDPEAYYRLMEKRGEEMINEHYKNFPEGESVKEKDIKIKKKKEEKNTETKKARLTYSEWLQQH